MNHKLFLAITTSILAAGSASAYDLTMGTNIPPVTFHGFASQGFLLSDTYNYLGNTKEGSMNFTEAGLNATMNPFARTRITAQGFLFDVGKVGEYKVALDYALVDYSFSDALGIRAGRIIRPEGIYNAIQSIDLARTSILLPQGMYDARERDFSGSIDGASIYGDVRLPKGGDLSYELYAGMVELSQQGGVQRYLGELLNNPPYTEMGAVNDFPELGAQLWWNTPLDGFRVGLAAFAGFGFSYSYYVSPLAYGKGNYNTYVDAVEFHPSLEYVWKNWTFQAEYKIQYYDENSEANGSSTGAGYSPSDCWYAGAAYRVNKWLEVGTYYTEDYANTENRDGAGTATPSDAYQKDWALSFRFDPKPWWVIKVEGHYIHGTALLQNNPGNPNRSDDGWFMLALKTTLSF